MEPVKEGDVRLSISMRLSEEVGKKLNRYYLEPVIREVLKTGVYGYDEEAVRRFLTELKLWLNGEVEVGEGVSNRRLIELARRLDLARDVFMDEETHKEFDEAVKAIDEDFVVLLNRENNRFESSSSGGKDKLREFFFLFKSAVKRIQKGAVYPPVFLYAVPSKEGVKTVATQIMSHLALLQELSEQETDFTLEISN